MRINTVILAAGKGTRMRSNIPKILHEVAGMPLLQHVHMLACRINSDITTIIYGHGGNLVPTTLSNLNVNWIEQKEQLGTGHAVQQVVPMIEDNDRVLILYGDVPLLEKSTLDRLLPLQSDNSVALLTVVLDDGTGYGRIVRNTDGVVQKIVEEKDATAKEKAITEINTGIMVVNGARLKTWLARLENSNAQKEYYLTDIIAMAVAEGIDIKTAHPNTNAEVLGVNNKQQLAYLERVYQSNKAESLMESGITIRDPLRFDVRKENLSLDRDVEIDINVILEGKVTIGKGTKIGPNTIITDADIGSNVTILANCVIENAKIGNGSRIGPFARIRPETELAEQVQIGNFVEIKKSKVAQGSKINHLSYIGDSVVGSNVNIGAGTITCNYDGANKFQTTIEDGAFIGSDTQLVAPVTIGKNATIGAGSTITSNTPEGKLTLSRNKQVSIEGWIRPKKKRS